MKKEEKKSWTIWYADGCKDKLYGTRSQAEAFAEERCVLHLGDYQLQEKK